MALSRFSRRLFIATAAMVLRAQTPEPDLLGHLALPRFTGSGTDQINAIATDRAGNIYVAGSTTSLDFPTKSAVQPQFGERLIHRSVNRGVTWQAISNPPEAPLALLPHPTDPAVILAASESGLFKSTGGDGSWRKVHEHEPARGPYAEVTMAIDPAHPQRAWVSISSVVNPGQLLVSENGGDSWQSRLPLSGSIPRGRMWVDPTGSGTLVRGWYISEDHGVTWTKMALPPAGLPSFTVPDPRHRGWIYGVTDTYSGSSVFWSQDWGKTWIELTAPPTRIEDLLLDPDRPEVRYAPGSLGTFYVSDNSGLPWRTLPVDGPGGLGRLTAAQSRQCGGGGLFSARAKSFDFGLSWSSIGLNEVTAVVQGASCNLYGFGCGYFGTTVKRPRIKDLS